MQGRRSGTRRALLEGFEHIGHRLLHTEGIGQDRERTAAGCTEVAFEQPLGGLYGPGVACGGEPCEQAQVSVRSAGVIPCVAGLGCGSGQRLERGLRTAGGQCVIDLLRGLRIGTFEPCQEKRFGSGKPLFSESIGERLFAGSGKQVVLAGLGEQQCFRTRVETSARRA